MDYTFKNIIFKLCFILLVLFWLACEPLVTQFEDVEECVLYSAKNKLAPPTSIDTIKVMTWNIRFGAGRIPWFGDCCGKRIILSEDEVRTNLAGIAEMINREQPDILLLQEVDIQSKRSAYVDQMQWLLDHTYFNYGAYASVWKAQVIPSDGLGRMDEGNATLSRWKITKRERIQLALRGDQDALTRYFYVRNNILKTKIDLPGLDNFWVVNTHTSAFSKDETKKKQIDKFKEELDKLDAAGIFFVAGGDLNELPPGSDSTDYCDEDKCSGESFHGPNDNSQHKEGSYYTPEANWLIPFYDEYEPAVKLENYLANEEHYFSQTELWNEPYDKKLDYLFTNFQWVAGSDSTHHDMSSFSDHAPVSARWEVPK